MELVNICRNKISESINWKCNIKYIYRDHNLGLAKNTVSAIDQIFIDNEYLIFIEDDNLVDPSFFHIVKIYFTDLDMM